MWYRSMVGGNSIRKGADIKSRTADLESGNWETDSFFFSTIDQFAQLAHDVVLSP